VRGWITFFRSLTTTQGGIVRKPFRIGIVLPYRGKVNQGAQIPEERRIKLT
jgi:hypothetical protein